MTKVYKIRNKTTGLFSDGGTYPQWKKNGKAYRSKAAITNWLNKSTFSGSKHRFADCEIVEYSLIITDIFDLGL
jgi:hypothetical protein